MATPMENTGSGPFLSLRIEILNDNIFKWYLPFETHMLR